MENQENTTIKYESFIAGALLKFDAIDNVEISLLVEYFKKQTKIELRGGLYYLKNNLDTYIEFLENGTIKLRDKISLDYTIKEEKCTLRDKLLNVAGNIVTNFFNSLDIEKYKQEKSKVLLENKNKVLSTANVLLISDIQEDYDELVKYGFKNVDYFKSIIRANNYFAKHPEELEKYHIILKGNQEVQDYCCLYKEVELDSKLSYLEKKKDILVISLYKYRYQGHVKFVSYLYDKINHRGWETEERTYTDNFDRIVENALINHILELKNKKFVPIKDYINPNRLPLPPKKSDLNILYLDSTRDNRFAKKIANELGLNIDFKEDNNCSLGKYVKSNLGKYDIIIVTRVSSRNILCMNHESTEQCKDTGRELTMFVTQDKFYWGVDTDLANGIELRYVFGGNYAPDSKCHIKDIRILRHLIEENPNDDYWTKDRQNEYSKIKGIIEASVNFYNKALLQNNKPAIRDLDLKTAEELDQDYVKAYNEKEVKDIENLTAIREFDDIRNAVSKYLRYRKENLISFPPNGLEITEGKNGIKIENIYNGRTYCSITFKKDYKQEYLRIFEIQTLSKKGNLSSPETIGLYTSKYEKDENIPNRPNEKQKNALLSIIKKINVELQPLNDNASNKHCKLERNKNQVLKRKPKKRIQ